MNGWHVRRGLSSDVPVFATALILFGGAVAIVVRGVVDLALHHHSTRRPPRG